MLHPLRIAPPLLHQIRTKRFIRYMDYFFSSKKYTSKLKFIYVERFGYRASTVNIILGVWIDEKKKSTMWNNLSLICRIKISFITKIMKKLRLCLGGWSYVVSNWVEWRKYTNSLFGNYFIIDGVRWYILGSGFPEFINFMHSRIHLNIW